MIFWLAAGGLTLVVVGLIARALLQQRQSLGVTADYDLEVYRDQLAELKRSVDNDLIGPDQAKAAEIELSRRMLDADRRRRMVDEAPSRRKQPMVWLSVVLASALPACAIAIYMLLGAPDYPAQPFAERADERRLAAQALERQRMAREMDPAQQRAMIQSMVEGLAERLREEPDDLDGWLRLARSYQVLGQPDAERDALAQAARIAPDNVAVLIVYARSLRAAAGNRPTADSLALMRRVAEIEPRNSEALWFLATAAAANGQRQEARDLFDRALAGLPPGDEGRDHLKAMAERILENAPADASGAGGG